MENQTTPVQYAGFWIRLVAEIFDFVILTAVAWLIDRAILGAVYWMIIWSHGPGVAPFADYFNPLWLQVFDLVVYALLSIPYYIWGQFKYGTTLGKYPFGIYVVNHGDLKPITMRQSTVRAIGYTVSSLPVGAGYLMAAFHPEKRALHDIMAGTISIIRRRRSAQAQVSP